MDEGIASAAAGTKAKILRQRIHNRKGKSEVDPSTLESRKTPGLYLCGEILGVPGLIGV